jgi:hypothetical protein
MKKTLDRVVGAGIVASAFAVLAAEALYLANRYEPAWEPNHFNAYGACKPILVLCAETVVGSKNRK